MTDSADNATGCVVVIGQHMDPKKDWYPTCGATVAGERGGWPMCAEHMDVFAPEARSDASEGSTP